MLLHRVVFVVNHANVVAIFQRAVVIERSEPREILPDRRLPDPPVEIHDIGMVFLDQFTADRASQSSAHAEET